MVGGRRLDRAAGARAVRCLLVLRSVVVYIFGISDFMCDREDATIQRQSESWCVGEGERDGCDRREWSGCRYCSGLSCCLLAACHGWLYVES